MKFTIAEHGFRFSVKPGIDIYVVRNPEFGWLAINALRPVETYVAFIQGVIDDSIYRAAKQAGVNEAAFHEYVRVMGFSVDFQREVRRGDQFEMMYDTQRDSLSGDIIGVSCNMPDFRFRVTSLVFTVLMAPKMPLDGTMKTAIQPRAP
jgi:hypothetical protein